MENCVYNYVFMKTNIEKFRRYTGLPCRISYFHCHDTHLLRALIYFEDGDWIMTDIIGRAPKHKGKQLTIYVLKSKQYIFREKEPGEK